jgi:hypothetical protein
MVYNYGWSLPTPVLFLKATNASSANEFYRRSLQFCSALARLG